MIPYIRVSTQDQADNGYGLDAQTEALRAEFDRRGWEWSTPVCDEMSAGSLDRPGLQMALKRIVEDEDGLVVAKLDRLTRSVQDFARLVDWFRDANAALVILDLQVDTSTPAGEMMANVMATFAQFERRMISQRTRDGLAARRAQGMRKEFSIPDELADRIRRLRAEGWTYRTICEALNRENVPTARGGAFWRPSSVQWVLGYRRKVSGRRTAELPSIK